MTSSDAARAAVLEAALRRIADSPLYGDPAGAQAVLAAAIDAAQAVLAEASSDPEVARRYKFERVQASVMRDYAPLFEALAAAERTLKR